LDRKCGMALGAQQQLTEQLTEQITKQFERRTT
jgi:hypothetical protein